ncbi:ankyrin repeat-containing domain protein [Massariosphaeria phaeospora]|uniref:Ankyrin repeat-containing domain protein n=1 Tax=Massariosphaeria phaeospora TaxID=100035 RepID=A0A7C8MR94_9PLEO|nr:ankyrin repeat-containing domain protein [Massariosphaeria phaeospora]
MKLKEWGYVRHLPRKATKDRGGGPSRVAKERADEEDADAEDSDRTTEDAVAESFSVEPASTQQTPVEESLNLLEGAQDLITTIAPWSDATLATESSLDMLACVLDGDSQKLELLIRVNPSHVNYPIGLPFDAHGGRFFNHPAMHQCVILQHPEQTILDIASGLPSGPVIWVLVAQRAKGSRHPLGTDLALHNAIKNGRTLTVQSLIHSGGAEVNGIPGTPWKPLLQATFWNVPDVVRILLDRGADVNHASPALNGMGFKTALQLCLDRRVNDFMNTPVREQCEKILKILLDSGANIHVRPAEDATLPPFETFIKPWAADPHWIGRVSATEIECLEAFIRKGANLQAPFTGFPCGAPTGGTFEHQVIWHSTPRTARLLIDYASPGPGGNGGNLLHEITGCCPDAKRHPADTLRDIDVLLKYGADPNSADSNGSSPLRRTIERCPAVDIIPRLQALLDGGADPELKDRNDVQPFVLAARAFDEPLLSQVMHVLLSKFKGRYPQFTHGMNYVWTEGRFPIPSEPTLAQVTWYSGLNAEFRSDMQQMLPADITTPFQKAVLNAASTSYLESFAHRAHMINTLGFTANEREDLRRVILLRQAEGINDFKCDEQILMALLLPQSVISQPMHSTIHYDNNILMPHQTPISCGPPSLSSTLALDSIVDPPNYVGLTSRRSSTSSNHSSSSFFVPTTTQIRWSQTGRATTSDDVEKARGQTLKYKCDSCDNGLLLTKAEYEKHDAEHWHTLSCSEVGCKRRFCVAERG